MENDILKQLANEKQPDVLLLCYLAKKRTPTPSIISEIFLPFFKRLSSYEYEIQVELSKVYGIHGSKEQNPYWLKNTTLIPVVTHYWLISQLMIIPEGVINDTTTYQIKNALHHINCNTRKQLEELLQILMQQNKVYDNEVLILLKRGIRNTKLSYKVCEKVLHYLLTSTEYEIVFSTCELIKKYPFIFSSIPEISLRKVMQRGELYEPLALQTLGVWGDNRIFKEVIEGKSWQLESKRVILSFLPLTTPLMDILTKYLIEYPTYSADWLDCLLRGAEQGVYINKKRIAEIIQHYFEYEFITAKQLVQLVDEKFKKELFNLLQESSDFDFQKRIQLYQELNTPYTRNKIVTHLKEIEDSTQLTILLYTISELKIIEAEPYIFPYIQNYPTPCLETLKHIGGSKTILYLKELLEFEVPVKQNIPSFEREALILLADLVPDHQVIINYLQKHQLPYINVPNLHVVLSPENEEYLLELLCKEEIETVQYGIEKLGELGTLKSLEPIIKKIGIMNPVHSNPWETITINSAWEASKKIVNRAYNQHKIRTKKSNQKLAVNTVLTEVLLKQFETPLSETDATYYLNYISEVIPSEFPIEKLSILAVSTNPHIIKFYISYLGKINTGTAIKQLKSVLNETENIYILRQAILALTVLKNNSLDSLVIPLLGHPNMNIKKTAAAYLTENGTLKAVTAMVNLFKRHKNIGLRNELEKGLKSILGKTYYFFLFNECFPCDISWQRELLESIITNDESIKEDHYIDFPELNTIVPLKKVVTNSKKDEELIRNWKTIRNRIKEDLSLFEKIEDLIQKIEIIKKQADFVFITDLIAATFRKFEKIPLSKSFKPVLNSEEARVAFAENNSDIDVLNTLLLDPENEKTVYNNMVIFKEDKKKEKIFFHFLLHYSLEKIVTKLIEENQINFLKKLFLNNKIAYSKYIPLLIKLHKTLKKQGDKGILKSLETVIVNHSFTNKIYQRILFFEKETVEGKIHKLASYNSQEQSLLKEEIIDLYKMSSWKQRIELLQTIKNSENHTALFELNFKHSLDGKKVSPRLFNTSQIDQFEKHSEAIEFTKERSYYLQCHSNEFILAYVKELTSDQETDPSLLSSFYQLSTERKWEILKPEITQGNYYWFSFFNNFAPINSELRGWFKKASSDGKLAFIKCLIDTNRSLYFPNLEKELLPFIKEFKEPIAWQLFFKLQFKRNKKELTRIFTNEYVGYSTSMKIELLSHLLYKVPNTLMDASVFKALISTDEKEEVLLIQLQLKTLDYKTVKIDIVVDFIKQLTKLDVLLAKQSLVEVLESSTGIGLEKQMKILSECYTIKVLSDTVTTQIVHLFSTELLALSFLTEEQRILFYKQVSEFIKVHNTEIDKKRLLKNLADESPDEVTPILMDVLSSKKKTELDALCLRLLKKTISKEIYLETCYSLLSSEKENLFSTIIKTLSFANYSPVIPTFIKLLSHKKFSKDSREGLLIMGEKIIPILTKEINKARPDKRNILTNLLAEIES
ncbi:HEAT repeat domain-containing protein [Tenacibaculum sp. M341]|uniref:HEAT repeat domain-containing protein n=1 Tax=Tenacibaculum sp. M341 TaxID=2530339 RepID=UPI001045E091|nr:HEAT repeat domain-containing protein [Tenacibaculum sp. M341]TCI84826.1 HEAT repeat domain-containing protein [Tenacibaculum sp. M341]